MTDLTELRHEDLLDEYLSNPVSSIRDELLRRLRWNGGSPGYFKAILKCLDPEEGYRMHSSHKNSANYIRKKLQQSFENNLKEKTDEQRTE